MKTLSRLEKRKKQRRANRARFLAGLLAAALGLGAYTPHASAADVDQTFVPGTPMNPLPDLNDDDYANNKISTVNTNGNTYNGVYGGFSFHTSGAANSSDNEVTITEATYKVVELL